MSKLKQVLAMVAGVFAALVYLKYAIHAGHQMHTGITDPIVADNTGLVTCTMVLPENDKWHVLISASPSSKNPHGIYFSIPGSRSVPVDMEKNLAIDFGDGTCGRTALYPVNCGEMACFGGAGAYHIYSAPGAYTIHLLAPITGCDLQGSKACSWNQSSWEPIGSTKIEIKQYQAP